MPKTTQAFLGFLDEQVSQARQFYLLGDLFEYWAGDDDLAAPLHRQVVTALRRLADGGVRIFWIPGNRDFLVGAAFAKEAGVTILPDPSVVDIAGKRIVLAHGDAQCTDDVAYMAFRAQVRQPAWQAAFLAQPLAQRKQIINGMRKGSREAQRMKSLEIMDVNGAAIDALFAQSSNAVMIHGHTHRPALHVTETNGVQRLRYVLPDWDCDAEPARGGWISLDADGRLQRLALDGSQA